MENEEKKTKQVKKSTTSTKKKATSTAKKSSTTKKSTTAKKKTTTTRKTVSKKEIEKLPVTLEKPIEIKEETVDDIDIVFQTRKIPQQIEQIEEPRLATVRIPREDDDEPPKKKKKKFKLTPVGIFTIAILFIIIDALFILFVVTTSNKRNEEKEAETINAIKKEEEKEDEKKPEEKEPVKVTDPNQEKLDKLDNINTKIDFFKNENIDRYLAYKEKNPDMDLEKVIVYVNIGLDKDFYTNVKNSPYVGTNTVITNKYYKLDSNYEPKGLTEISSSYSSGSRKMVKDAALAFNDLAQAAKKEGYNIRAVSTYRSYSYQKDLYSRYANNDGVKKADTYSARAGHSEHQTGLAVDVDNINNIYTSFGSTKEFTWMKNNAYKYGFILRYTKENEWITGYKDEPWHYRYVGKDIAKYIWENPMTYEEYFVRFLDK